MFITYVVINVVKPKRMGWKIKLNSLKAKR